MPTYQYRCTECDHAFEQFQSFTDDALSTCPECGGRLRKVFNAVGVVFKGSGFYRNDSRQRSASDSSTSTGSDTSTATSSGSDSQTTSSSSDSSTGSTNGSSKTSGSSGSSTSGSSTTAGASTSS